jgi:uncharacterized membrane protein
VDSIVPIVLWWLGLSVCGWVAFGLLGEYFKDLPDRGYALSKPIGLIGLAYIAWLLASLHLIPFGTWSVRGLLVAGGVVSVILAWRWKRTVFHKINRLVLLEEGIFMAAIAAWSIVRSFNPRAEGVEKLMDVAILNGLLRSDWLPPADVWYGGDPINYYYFGHFLVATITKLTGVSVEYATNLGLIGVFALSVTTIISLVIALSGSKLAAFLSAFLFALSSNLDPAIHAIKQTKDYIFFSATRLDPYTINEFPLYSFVVADMHAHMLDLAVVTAIIGVLFVIFQQRDRTPWVLLAVLSLLLGATGPTNSFDLVIYGALTGLVLLLRQLNISGLQWRPALGAVGLSLAVGMASLLLYLPFYLNFHPGVGGVGVALFQTPLLFILNNFGIMLFICLPLFWLLPRLWNGLQKRGQLPELPAQFGIIVLAIALLAILVPEFIYLKDIYHFENPPFARANTIFKVYYQAWVLLAMAAGVGLGYFHKVDWRPPIAGGYAIITGLLLGLSLVGTWQGFATLRGQTSTTLDGYAYLQNENPDQLAMINWLNEHVNGQPNLLEAAGESYTQRSRVSAYTGLITPIGWASHEWGWRYSADRWNEIASRMGDVQLMYTTTDPAELRRLADKWHINYIVASQVEWQQYHLSSFGTIESLYGPPVFEKGDYRLYRVGNSE